MRKEHDWLRLADAIGHDCGGDDGFTAAGRQWDQHAALPIVEGIIDARHQGGLVGAKLDHAASSPPSAGNVARMMSSCVALPDLMSPTTKMPTGHLSAPSTRIVAGSLRA